MFGRREVGIWNAYSASGLAFRVLRMDTPEFTEILKDLKNRPDKIIPGRERGLEAVGVLPGVVI